MELQKGKEANGYWNKERCAEEALKCETRLELKIKNNSVYEKARKFRWLDDICQHMPLVKGVWPKER